MAGLISPLSYDHPDTSDQNHLHPVPVGRQHVAVPYPDRRLCDAGFEYLFRPAWTGGLRARIDHPLRRARLQDATERLLKGRTSFVVAHRLSTIRKADTVLVLDHGHIIERNSHSELLTLDGTYAQLYRQFISATEEKDGL
jgi:hypothetical protein